MKEEKSAGDGDRAIPPLASFRLGFSSNNRFDDVFFPIASIIFFLAPPSPLSPRSLSLPPAENPSPGERSVSRVEDANQLVVKRDRVEDRSKRRRKRRRRTRRDDGEKRKEKKRKEKNLDVGKVRSLDRDKRERWGDTVVVLRL